MSKINNSNAKKDEIVNFPHHLPIELVYSNAITYKPGSANDSATKAKPNAWHQIVVHHKNVVEGAEGKQIILDAIFNAINGKELYPVAYRQRQDKDVFLVRDCKPALDELFKLNLVIQTATGRYLNIEVQLNVAEYKIGQVSPLTAIPTLLNKLLCSYKGHKGILNLSEFANRKEFFEVSISLTSRGVLQRICDTIYKNDALFRQINGLVLSDNGINCLEPLKVFENMPLVVLDLRRNQLSSGTRLAKELANIKADELFLEGNPLLKDSSSYRQFLKEVMNNFPRVDGKPIQELLKTKLPKEIDPVKHGYRIDWTNKDHILKFSGSLQWHAVMIPDPEHAYDKTSIIGYFFLTISPELGELYPCYYKYVNGEHQFMLRDCFEQLQFLVEQRSLQITIPTLFNNDDPGYQPLSLHYYLLMNVSHFTKDQVEMKSALSKAMTSRYRIVDRVLDLSNLQKAKGLEQIVINLSCPVILQRVLTIAARKYTSNCVELYLCNNLIVSANVPQILALMDNLRVLDLGHNWIHDLADISDLSSLNLVSLRLDGNPLCSKYSLAGEYIKAVQAEFPTLKRLDNKEIPQNAYLCPQKNYLCSVEGYDFVDQFVPTYFKLFESAKRAELNEMYYAKSTLSITYNFEPTNQNPYKEERLNKYRKHSRNLLRRNLEERELYTGQVAIMNVLMALPMVEYDMLSFKTDTILYNADMVMLSISGVFMDKGSSLEDADMLLYFTRTFILKRTLQGVGELNCGQLYKISNDLLHICHPTRFQKENAFKIVVQKEITKTDGPAKGKDKDIVLVVFQAITSLKTVWCKRCLEDGKWDLTAALEVFAKLCDTNEIPLTAFK